MAVNLNLPELQKYKKSIEEQEKSKKRYEENYKIYSRMKNAFKQHFPANKKYFIIDINGKIRECSREEKIKDSLRIFSENDYFSDRKVNLFRTYSDFASIPIKHGFTPSEEEAENYRKIWESLNEETKKALYELDKQYRNLHH